MRWFTALMMVLALVGSACDDGDGACKPNCDGLECGNGGCPDEPGACGICAGDGACVDGFCCTPECPVGQLCGPDGCNGTCGACQGGTICDPASYLCVEPPDPCEPRCVMANYECGDDGCGGSCGSCTPPDFCIADIQQCGGVCVPDCDGLECGDDGCGDSCGECEDGQFCENGLCVGGGTLPDEDFLILFNYRGRIPGYNDDQADLHLIKPDGANPLVDGEVGSQPLTSFYLEDVGDCQLVIEDAQGNPVDYEPCSCKYGCLVDKALQWIAIAIKKPTASGFTFQLGRFDPELGVKMIKGVTLSDVIDFKFGGNYLYFSKLLQCEGLSCQYTVHRVQLDPVGQPEELLVFPPDNDPDWPKHSNYKGHFKVSEDGEVLVLIGTTIRSARLYMWKGGNLHELDYICAQMMAGECIGAGSEYTDTDPVAISPDSSVVAAFTIAERDLRLRLYDTDTMDQKYLNLFSVPAGGYLTNICPNIMAEPWKFKKVIGDPVFTRDGTSLLFLAYDDCALSSSEDKPETDIYMVDLASVGDGTPFEKTDFVNLTKNPKHGGSDNQLITGFDLSPEGKVLTFTASPFWGNDRMLADDDKRALKDRELWVIGVNGAGKTQITDTSDFEASAPKALSVTVLPGRGEQ